MSLVDLHRVVSKGTRVGSGKGGGGQVGCMMDEQLKGHLSKLQLLLCLLLLHLFARPFATSPLLLRILVLGTATAPLLPKRHRGSLLLLLELRSYGALYLTALILLACWPSHCLPLLPREVVVHAVLMEAWILSKVGAFTFPEESLACTMICATVSREGGILVRRRVWMLSGMG